MPERLPITARDVHRRTGSDLGARGLGFLSLMLGAMEVAGARPLAAMLGIRGQENFVRLCGAREILQGAAILTARDPTLWVWVRVAGDALTHRIIRRRVEAASVDQRHVAPHDARVGVVSVAGHSGSVVNDRQGLAA